MRASSLPGGRVCIVKRFLSRVDSIHECGLFLAPFTLASTGRKPANTVSAKCGPSVFRLTVRFASLARLFASVCSVQGREIVAETLNRKEPNNDERIKHRS